MLGATNDAGQSRGSLGGGFLPEDYVQRKAEGRANILGLALFSAVMGTVVAAFFVTNRSWTAVHEEREAISVEYSAAEPEIEKLIELEEQKEQMLEKAEIVTALIEPVPRSILLAEIVTRMPKQMTLLSVDLEGRRVMVEPAQGAKPARGAPAGARGRQIGRLGGQKTNGGGAQGEDDGPAVRAPRYDYTLTLTGVTPKNTEVADYLEALKASPLLRRVELHFTESEKLKDVELRKFEISAQIDPQADARGIEAPATTVDAMRMDGGGGTPGEAEDRGESYTTVPDGAEGQP